MPLSRLGYYVEFAIFPLIILALAAAGLVAAGIPGLLAWSGLVLVSLFAWTFFEYALHRFVFHHVPVIREQHFAHHDHERELIGTPSWVSLAVAAVIILPAFALFGLEIVSAVSVGLMAGYVWYITVHHLTHFGHPPHGSWLYRLKRHHALHHHAEPGTNFGVTTPFWDWVFGTLSSRA